MTPNPVTVSTDELREISALRNLVRAVANFRVPQNKADAALQIHLTLGPQYTEAVEALAAYDAKVSELATLRDRNMQPCADCGRPTPDETCVENGLGDERGPICETCAEKYEVADDPEAEELRDRSECAGGVADSTYAQTVGTPINTNIKSAQGMVVLSAEERVARAVEHLLPSAPSATQEAQAVAYAERIVRALHRNHYSGVTQFEPLSGDLMGLLSQIDHMITGIPSAPNAIPAGHLTDDLRALVSEAAKYLRAAVSYYPDGSNYASQWDYEADHLAGDLEAALSAQPVAKEGKV